jgi:hypothetical protein
MGMAGDHDPGEQEQAAARGRQRAARAKARELNAHERAALLHDQAAALQQHLGHDELATAARRRAEHARERHALALKEQADQQHPGS